jgi:hypothetical protein
MGGAPVIITRGLWQRAVAVVAKLANQARSFAWF